MWIWLRREVSFVSLNSLVEFIALECQVNLQNKKRRQHRSTDAAGSHQRSFNQSRLRRASPPARAEREAARASPRKPVAGVPVSTSTETSVE